MVEQSQAEPLCQPLQGFDSIKTDMGEVVFIMPICKVDVLWDNTRHNTQPPARPQEVCKLLPALEGMMEVFNDFGAGDEVILLFQYCFIWKIKWVIEAHVHAGIFKQQRKRGAGAASKIQTVLPGVQVFEQRIG